MTFSFRILVEKRASPENKKTQGNMAPSENLFHDNTIVFEKLKLCRAGRGLYTCGEILQYRLRYTL